MMGDLSPGGAAAAKWPATGTLTNNSIATTGVAPSSAQTSIRGVMEHSYDSYTKKDATPRQEEEEEEDLLSRRDNTPTASEPPPDSRMSAEEMRLFMEEEGLPLFVYNKELQTEPKRLLLNSTHTLLSLVDNDVDDEEGAFEPGSASFNLTDLECIRLGDACQFAKLLQPVYDSSDPLLLATMESSAPTDRLAALKFVEGSLCVRFLSATLRDAAMDVFKEICPNVSIIAKADS